MTKIVSIVYTNEIKIILSNSITITKSMLRDLETIVHKIADIFLGHDCMSQLQSDRCYAWLTLLCAGVVCILMKFLLLAQN